MPWRPDQCPQLRTRVRACCRVSMHVGECVPVTPRTSAPVTDTLGLHRYRTVILLTCWPVQSRVWQPGAGRPCIYTVQYSIVTRKVYCEVGTIGTRFPGMRTCNNKAQRVQAVRTCGVIGIRPRTCIRGLQWLWNRSYMNVHPITVAAYGEFGCGWLIHFTSVSAR